MVRKGFEPSKFNPASSSNFAIGDGDDEPSNVGKMHGDSEEARYMHEESQDEEPSEDTDTRYGTLDDRHIWQSRDGEDS